MRTHKTSTQTDQKACGTCVHFRLSLREGGGRGMCMFFRQLMTKEGFCTAGYQPRESAQSPDNGLSDAPVAC